MKENLLTLYNQFGSPLLESFVGKTIRKRPTEIIDDMNSEVFAYVPDEDVLRRFIINNGIHIDGRVRLKFPFDVDFEDESLKGRYEPKGIGFEIWDSEEEDYEFFGVDDTNVYATWNIPGYRMSTDVYKNFYTELSKDQQREIIASLNTHRRLQGLPPLKSPKDFLTESMVRKISSKKKTDILNDNDFQMFEDFESFEEFLEEKSREYNLRMFEDYDANASFGNQYFWGFFKTVHLHQKTKEYRYTDKFGNSVILWISDIHSFVEEESIEEDYEGMELPQGLLLEMFVIGQEETSRYMIVDPQFKSITRQEIPYKFIPYKSITPAFVERLLEFIVSFVNYFSKSLEESIMEPLGDTGEEFTDELTTEMVDNLLTNTIFPEIVKNM